jgi:NAD-dependent SIR2 family protein deacetylase
MSPDSSPLGHCPECGRSIPDGWKLIEYERADGEPGVFAECPSCESIIRPE